MSKETPWQNLDSKEVLQKLKTSHNGLSQAEAQKRLRIYGPNIIIKQRNLVEWKILFSQFTNFLIIILILATVIAFLAGKITTGVVIFFTIVLNVILGFAMEHRAEKSVLALKKMLVLFVRVIRDNKEQKIETSSLVPGDIIILEEGMKIPADSRILKAVNLEVNEASLTGESMPVRKKAELDHGELETDLEHQDMVFMGTIITKGYGKAVVVETGMRTAFGRIAEMLGEIKEPASPLQRQITVLGKRIAIIGFSVAAFILIFGTFNEIFAFISALYFVRVIDLKNVWSALYEQTSIALSLFVSIVPQGLLLVLTLALALGAHRMARRKAVIKRLNTVETLGCAQVICTDKTGTLTKNEMKVQKIWIGGKELEIGEKEFSLSPLAKEIKEDIALFLKIGVISNTAKVYPLKQGRGFEILGDPTEASLLVLATKAGIKERELKSKGKMLAEFSFDQTLKRRTVVWFTPYNHESGNTGQEQEYGRDSCVVFSVGAPETILEISNKILKQGREIHLCLEQQQEIIQTFESLASRGYRMIALAYKKIRPKEFSLERKNAEKDLVFVGLAAIYDPPRPEARQAIKMCREAGIRVIMITGDNKLTALAIAEEVGLSREYNKKVVTGKELDQMSEAEFSRAVDKINVFARTTPAHKLKIVKVLQEQNKVVAVTGDGVNDAPALKEADIGIAMGITGTDVAKEASKMIIIDDNFATIVKATKEGRTIFDNIKKFTQFLLSANAIEAPLIIVAMLLGLPLPLHPLHILWINLVTDSIPAVTLSIEPACKGIMKRKPRPFKETIFKGIVSPILIIGGLGFLMALAIFAYIYFIEDGGVDRARTMAFTFIVLFKLFFVFSCRSFTTNILKLGFLTNKKMILAVLFSCVLQLIVVHTPLMQVFFKTVSLTYIDWLILLPLSVSGLAFMEIRKIWMGSDPAVAVGV